MMPLYWLPSEKTSSASTVVVPCVRIGPVWPSGSESAKNVSDGVPARNTEKKPLRTKFPSMKLMSVMLRIDGPQAGSPVRRLTAGQSPISSATSASGVPLMSKYCGGALAEAMSRVLVGAGATVRVARLRRAVVSAKIS